MLSQGNRQLFKKLRTYVHDRSATIAVWMVKQGKGNVGTSSKLESCPLAFQGSQKSSEGSDKKGRGRRNFVLVFQSFHASTLLVLCNANLTNCMGVLRGMSKHRSDGT